MLGLNRWSLLKGLTAIVCIVGIISLALAYFIPAPPSTFKIATGFKGGSALFVGNRYKERIAPHGVKVDVLETDGSGEDFKLLMDPKSGVKVAVIQGGVSNSNEMPGLLSLGRVNYQIFWIFYRGTDTLNDLTQLKGKRISVGPTGSGTQTVAAKVLSASGVTSNNSTFLPLAGENAADALKAGTVDVMFLANTDNAPLYKTLLRDPNLRVMNIRRAEALSRMYPFLVRLVLPEGVIDLEKNIPATDVTTFATTNVIIVREDTHPAIISLLIEAMVEEHGAPGLFNQTGAFPTQSDPEFPMAPTARDFYKNGPSFLNRYLPFWMVSHVQRLLAVLLAAGVIVYPLFNFAPKLYQWVLKDRMNKLYRRLRVVEQELQAELTAPQVVALQTELENINRAARILPKRNSDMFFDFNRHIESMRTLLASRLLEVRSQTLKLVEGVAP
jgi:TRAP-type uncharacterized transport system substrate-binding protein